MHIEQLVVLAVHIYPYTGWELQQEQHIGAVPIILGM